MFTGTWYGPIFCKVISSERIYPDGVDDGVDRGKWSYAVTSMDFGDEYAFPAGADTNPAFTFLNAMNIWELNNDETTQYGVTVEDLPGDFELKPVPNGAYVMVWTRNAKSDTQGFELCLFQYPNQFDGDC
ncbi:MAG: hypothetical protein GY904_22100 [Planctomycetaceae bacterium]|nr:hypothetical protein [Planctomycetaceae bacterium]